MTDPRLGLASASIMFRVANCPGSLNAERLFSQDDSTDVTREGDHVHDALRDDDLSDLEENEAVIAARLQEMRDGLISQWLKDTGSKKKELLEFREQRYWLHSSNRKICSAQLDWGGITGQEALVIDTKSGYKDVAPSHRNWQIKTQVICLWKNHPELRQIRGAIAAFRFRERESGAGGAIPDLIRAEREIRFFCGRAEDPEAERVSGEWCEYCKAKANCPVAASHALLPVPYLPPDKPKRQDEAALQAVAHLTLEQLGYLQGKRNIALKIFEAITNRLRSFSEKELASIGYKTAEWSRSEVTDLSGLFRAFIGAGLIKKEECSSTCKLVIGRLADIAIPRLLEQGVSTKAEAAKRIARMVEGYSSQTPCAKRVIKMSKEERNAHAEKNK